MLRREVLRSNRVAAVEVGASLHFETNPAKGVRAEVCLVRTHSGVRLVRFAQPLPAWGALKPVTAGIGRVTASGSAKGIFTVSLVAGESTLGLESDGVPMTVNITASAQITVGIGPDIEL